MPITFLRIHKRGTGYGLAIALLLSVATLASCTLDRGTKPVARPQPMQTADAARALQALAARHARLILQTAPEWSTQLGVSEEIGGSSYKRRLASYSPAANASLYELAQTLHAQLRAIDRERLAGQDLITYDVMLNAYALAQQQNRFRIGHPSVLSANPPYVVNQLFGPQIDLPRLLAAQHPVRTADDADAFLMRLAQIDRVLDELTAMTIADAERGTVPPYFALEAIAKSATAFVESAAADHPIATAFHARLENLGDLDGAARDKLHDRAVALLTNDVYPAYRRFGEQMTALIPAAGQGAGVWRLEDGDKIYQVALDAWGAGGLTPDEIHRIGLDDVARIHRQMNAILTGVGYGDGPVGARMAALATDPTYLVPNTDDAKAQLVETLKENVAEVMALAPQWFAAIPTQRVEIRRIPVHEQASASGGYYTPPALDGSRPGIFWINLKDTADTPTYTLKSLVFHETVPGHHFQAAKAMSISGLPLIQKMLWFGDYGEGWALYAEELAREMGLYRGDPLGDLGRLRMELYRAARLVVDTGLHHKRWSREEAIDYMVDVTGESRNSIAREIERYAVWPGQAASYKLGMIQFQRLRRKAENALGDRFDIREFHNVVLREGAMPIVVLEGRVDAWIDAAKRR